MGVIFIYIGLFLYVTEYARGFHVAEATGALIVVLGLVCVFYSGWQYFKKPRVKTNTNDSQLP
jgi:hypothetical protein